MERVLVLDDEESICTALQFGLEDDYDVFTAQEAETAFRIMADNDINLILLDQRLGAVDGLEVLKEIRIKHPQTSVIAMTAYGSIESSVEAMRLGAYYYITKPLVMAELKVLMQKALDYQNLHRQIARLTIEVENKYLNLGLIGQSTEMRQLFEQIEKIKDIDSTVLITGESGTGKELVARSIHFLGKRRQAPFEAVNCAAIPDQLLESELFGFEKGAFTGALHHKKGKFELAEQGTLFLDEIAELNFTLQAKLLRVLQSREFTPLGAEKAKKANVRIIAATNKNLKEAVRKGSFRDDLYFRLNVIPLEIPPLRQRKEDLPRLVGHFLSKYTNMINRRISGISRAAFHYLEQYDYPGNVRELENMIERMVALSHGPQIEVADLPPEVLGESRVLAEKGPWVSIQYGEPLALIEKKVIMATLDANQGNRRETARVLGMSERNLRYKLKEYGEQHS